MSIPIHPHTQGSHKTKRKRKKKKETQHVGETTEVKKEGVGGLASSRRPFMKPHERATNIMVLATFYTR
jgi:hypothetical protein